MTDRQILHYLLGAKLGEGGMGVVYKATDTRLNRPVALKFLNKTLDVEDAGRKRFLREARAASSANHPNVCVIHAIEESEGEEFIVMEYVEGLTLRKWADLRRHGSSSGAISDRELINVVRQIAEGLDAAHAQGIVHRDLKPENVMVTPSGRVKIMDFGLAKLLGESRLTRTGATVGTVAYMSPEQVKGGEIDRRSDIYSFGVVLYDLLTGELPFRADHAVGMMYAIVHTEPRTITSVQPGVDPTLARIVAKCMEKEASRRYGTMSEVIRDISTLEEKVKMPGRSVPTARSTNGLRLYWQSATATAARKTLVAAGAAVVLMLAVALVVTMTEKPTGAGLTIQSFPTGARVWINGAIAGTTPIEHLRRPAVPSNFHFELAEHATLDTLVALADNQEFDLRVFLNPVMRESELVESHDSVRTHNVSPVSRPIVQFSSTQTAPTQPPNIEGLATAIIDSLRRQAGVLNGTVSVRPFTFENTHAASDFSRYLKSLLEARIGTMTSWRLSRSEDSAGVTWTSVPRASYQLTGEYWEKESRVRFFSRLEQQQTGRYSAQAVADVSLAAIENEGVAWKPSNIKQIIKEQESLGKPLLEGGQLKLDLLTNKGTDNLLFTEGDTMRTYVKVNMPCRVRVFYYAVDGVHYVLTGPNDLSVGDSLVNSLIPVDISACSAPFGAEILDAYATVGTFEPIQVKMDSSGYYVLNTGIEGAVGSTRGIKKLGSGRTVVEKRAVITTVPK